MLCIYNGVFRDEKMMVDVVQIDPAIYELDGNYIWFDVGVAVVKPYVVSPFRFYLADSNKKMINPVLVLNSDHYDKTKIDFAVMVGFDFKPDFFYNVPLFGFHCDTYKRVELIELTY